MSHSARDSRDTEAHNTGSGHQSLHQGDGPQNIFTGASSTQNNHHVHNFYSNTTVTSDAATAFSDLLGGYGNAAVQPTRSIMIKWLSYHHEEYIDNDAHYRILLKKHVTGTNAWVVKNEQFKNWQAASEAAAPSAPRCLWVQGTLGSGKTMLCAYIVRHLRNSPNVPERSACLQYYVKNRRDPDDRPPSSSPRCLIRSLLIQILRWLPSESVHSAFDDEFKRFHRTNVPPDLAACWALLKAQASVFDRVNIVIDSLDQYNDERSRLEVFSMLRELPANMRVMITSRSGAFHLAESQLGVHGTLRLEPSRDDIGIYVQSRIKEDDFMRGEVKLQLKERIVERVTRASNGLFLLLELHLDCLCKQGSIAGINDALVDLAKNVDTAFKASVDQINNVRSSPSVTDFERHLARHTLTWIIHALRPLTADEIMESFAIRWSTDRPEDYSRKKVNWTLICAGLVDEDPDSKVVQLVHESVGQYLLNTSFVARHNSHAMASQCLKYLLVDGPSSRQHDKPRPLFKYAASNWVAHFSAAQKEQSLEREAGAAGLSELEELALKFLRNAARVSASFDAMSRPDLDEKDTAGMTGLHAATYLDLPDLADMLVRDGSIDINATTHRRQTALHWAVRYNRSAMVESLLEHDGIDRNLIDKRRDAPLHYAVVWSVGNRDDIVQMLVRKPGIHLHQRGHKGHSPLSWAVQHGPPSTAKILVLALDNVNERDSLGWSPLRIVMYHGQDTMLFDLLLRKGAELNMPENDGWTPLMHAVQYRNSSQVRRLLARKTAPANADLKDPTGMSPLRQALKLYFAEIADLLIEYGANVDEKFDDDEKSTPLIELVISGDHDTIFNLLRMGPVDLNHQDSRGKTALHHAVERQNGPITWLLMSRGAGLTFRDTNGDSLLDIAVVRNDVQIAWLLCHQGAPVNAMDGKGMTSLHKACGMGNTESVRLLLSWGASQDLRDEPYGLTPLQHLAENGPQREAITRLLQKASLDGGS